MARFRNWRDFPMRYREGEMEQIAQWMATGESCSVVGLSGMGRNNLLGFLCTRSEVLQSYLPEYANTVALVPVDLSCMPTNDSATLYRVILRSFYWVQETFAGELAQVVARLYEKIWETENAFQCQSLLYELFFAFQQQSTQVVLVLSRFDYFCQDATPQLLNTLRGLRDSLKETVSFVVGLDQEVVYLPKPEALGEMYELLDSHVCWVGAMNVSDANFVIHQATYMVDKPPTEKEKKQIRELSGHIPVLLKLVSHWWLEHRTLPPAEVLAKEHHIQHRLARLWNGLTQEEQFALSAIQTWQQSSAKSKIKALEKLNSDHGAILSRLVEKGLSLRMHNQWQIRSELLANYVNHVGPYSRGRLHLDQKTEEIYQGLTPLPNLQPLEYNLLRFLIEHPYKRHTHSDLISAIWSCDQDDYQKSHVQALVRTLRKRIEVASSNARYLLNWKGHPEGGYQLYPEGRPEQGGQTH